ncbi:hypothetical protein LKO27_12695 [Tessaracoccus sp. OS52]|uniref:esterase/lipase family protein n=1 Tax=Tessaracoccus sp. OS52 TaxID=2886691 RepID=UPI001D100475|nr:hypothetical protein [Tessaracoccus sp. OS52]MCC2594265.1 hypothetical protein [Tessaracoccus sp. OS52]
MADLRSRVRRGRAAGHDWLLAGVDLAGAMWRRVRPVGALHVEPHPDCREIPLVLLPGILEPWSYLAPMGTWLQQQGHPVHYVETLGWNLGDLAASAESCLATLRERNVERAVVVAHSKGGLIGKAMLTEVMAERGGSFDRSRKTQVHGTTDALSAADEEPVVVGVVAVATPFSGSTLGGLLQRLPLVHRTPVGMFLPGSPQLSALAREQAVNAHIVSLAPEWDQVIPGGSHLEGATNFALDVPGHFRPVRDRGVWEIVHEFAHTLAETAR